MERDFLDPKENDPKMKVATKTGGHQYSSLGKDDKIQMALETVIQKGDNHFMCKQCGKTLKGKRTAAWQHYEVHLEEGFEYVCPKCLSVVKNKFLLKSHLRTSHGLVRDTEEMGRFKRQVAAEARQHPKKTCPLCGESFNNPGALKKLQSHLTRIHEDVGNEYQCPECQLVLDKKYYIYQHIKDVHGVTLQIKSMKKFILTKLS